MQKKKKKQTKKENNWVGKAYNKSKKMEIQRKTDEFKYLIRRLNDLINSQ